MSGTVLYRFHDASGQCLYVGITDRGPRRWREHMAERPWWPEVASVRVEHYDTRSEAVEAEEAAIRAEHPLHNVMHNTVKGVPAMAESKRSDRIEEALERGLGVDSLVGSFFHSGPNPGWQGCVIAEPHPGVYLVELFEWISGSSSCQRLIRLERMIDEDWQFYDDAKWMSNVYEHGQPWRQNGHAKDAEVAL